MHRPFCRRIHRKHTDINHRYSSQLNLHPLTLPRRDVSVLGRELRSCRAIKSIFLLWTHNPTLDIHTHIIHITACSKSTSLQLLSFLQDPKSTRAATQLSGEFTGGIRTSLTLRTTPRSFCTSTRKNRHVPNCVHVEVEIFRGSKWEGRISGLYLYLLNRRFSKCALAVERDRSMGVGRWKKMFDLTTIIGRLSFSWIKKSNHNIEFETIGDHILG